MLVIAKTRRTGAAVIAGGSSPAFGLSALVRRQQRMQPGRIAELGPGHVDHEGPVSVRGRLDRADRSSGALVMSISSGAVTTGTPLTTSKRHLPSRTFVTSCCHEYGCAERRCCRARRRA